MNVEAYMRRYIATECLKWNKETDSLIAVDTNYPFLQNRSFSEDEMYEIEEGLLFQSEIAEIANTLENNLIRNGRTYFEGYDIRIENYQGSVFFGEVTCQITYTHKVTENQLFLCEVYFRNEDGEILQAVMEF